MIVYLIGQALQNELPDRRVATLLTQTLVSAADPAFGAPTKSSARCTPSTRPAGWPPNADGRSARTGRRGAGSCPRPVHRGSWRRRCCAPRWPPARSCCARAAVVPVVHDDRTARLRGVDAVVDKDLTPALLAEALGMDALLLLTDVPAVMAGFGTPTQRAIGATTPHRLRALRFPEGSMGPKVDAACRFVERTGGRAVIDALDTAPSMLRGSAGTVIRPAGDGAAALAKPPPGDRVLRPS